MAECKGMPEYNESLIRHIFFNQIRAIKMKFGDKYGEIVLCYDSRKPSWRKNFYPQYKASRKKSREDSGIDWNQLFEFLNRLKDEVDHNFPYRVMALEGAEADDIIAVMCHKNPNEHNMIVSNDKDFYQLHRYENTYQYSIYHKAIVKCENPEKYLFEHTLRGDKGDGVPNYLSSDDTFVSKKRQRSITEKHVEDMWHKKTTDPNWQNSMSVEDVKNFSRNDLMINLDNIPSVISDSIFSISQEPNTRTRANIHKYFAAQGMHLMIENTTDF